MVLQIVTKKRYIKKEWGINVAQQFNKIVDDKIILIASQPNIGADATIKKTKNILVGKDYQNKIYYRVEKNKLIIIDLIDSRRNPKKNLFNTTT